jgi:hypothetical protein
LRESEKKKKHVEEMFIKHEASHKAKREEREKNERAR